MLRLHTNDNGTNGKKKITLKELKKGMYAILFPTDSDSVMISDSVANLMRENAPSEEVKELIDEVVEKQNSR